jgi:hypothetical protein
LSGTSASLIDAAPASTKPESQATGAIDELVSFKGPRPVRPQAIARLAAAHMAAASILRMA